MKYFISYTTRDKIVTKGFLGKINEFFLAKGEVYIDLLHNNSSNKQERVLRELNKCDELVLIETKSINESNWVRIELEEAKKLNKKIKSYSYLELEKLIKER
jgi:hypothetical protein